MTLDQGAVVDDICTRCAHRLAWCGKTTLELSVMAGRRMDRGRFRHDQLGDIVLDLFIRES